MIDPTGTTNRRTPRKRRSLRAFRVERLEPRTLMSADCCDGFFDLDGSDTEFGHRNETFEVATNRGTPADRWRDPPARISHRVSPSSGTAVVVAHMPASQMVIAMTQSAAGTQIFVFSTAPTSESAPPSATPSQAEEASSSSPRLTSSRAASGELLIVQAESVQPEIPGAEIAGAERTQAETVRVEIELPTGPATESVSSSVIGVVEGGAVAGPFANESSLENTASPSVETQASVSESSVDVAEVLFHESTAAPLLAPSVATDPSVVEVLRDSVSVGAAEWDWQSQRGDAVSGRGEAEDGTSISNLDAIIEAMAVEQSIRLDSAERATQAGDLPHPSAHPSALPQHRVRDQPHRLAAGMILLPQTEAGDSSHATPAADLVEATQPEEISWSDGIGWFRAFEAPQAEVGMLEDVIIAKPAVPRSTPPSPTTTRRDDSQLSELPEPTQTTAQRALGVVACGLGVHFLHRRRKQRDRETGMPLEG